MLVKIADEGWRWGVNALIMWKHKHNLITKVWRSRRINKCFAEMIYYLGNVTIKLIVFLWKLSKNRREFRVVILESFFASAELSKRFQRNSSLTHQIIGTSHQFSTLPSIIGFFVLCSAFLVWALNICAVRGNVKKSQAKRWVQSNRKLFFVECFFLSRIAILAKWESNEFISQEFLENFFFTQN